MIDDITVLFDDDYCVELAGGTRYRRIKGFTYYWSGSLWKMCMVQNWTMILDRGTKIFDEGE